MMMMEMLMMMMMMIEMKKMIDMIDGCIAAVAVYNPFWIIIHLSIHPLHTIQLHPFILQSIIHDYYYFYYYII